MNEQKDFSIIIPTYLEEKFIEKCLQSIINQNYNRNLYEVIVSDAQSDDNTIEIARNYADKIIIDQRKGIAYGRNIGAKASCGKILLFVDADTILDKNFLLVTKNAFDDDIVGMTGIAFPSDGNVLQRVVYYGTYLLVKIFYFFGLSLFPGICVAYKREKFFKVNGFCEKFGVVEDLDLSKRISKIGKCVVNSKAKAFVSTRRLKSNIISTVLFHIYCDVRYLIFGTAPAYYPKVEESNLNNGLWNDALKKKY